MKRLTKIICTIGPASWDKENLSKLIDAGMNIARLNCSHGSSEEKARTIRYIRELMVEKNVNVGILLDNKGPEIRTKKLENSQSIFLEKGKIVTITTEDTIGNQNLIVVDYKNLAKDLSVGKRILMDDGLIELEVKQIIGNELKCLVLNSNELGENKSVNLPGTEVNLPSLIQKDIDDLIFGCEQGIDYYALSFTRRKDDVLAVKKILKEQNATDIKIICKIENQEGIDNFDDILEETDGIMVARGDLGVEIALENLPIEQKKMISKSIEAEKIVITATEMLDSMIRNPRPTNAEVTDVANAILDGSDAVMLSGETAKGKYPIESVSMMRKICERTDIEAYNIKNNFIHNFKSKDNVDYISKSIFDIANNINARCIVVASQTGKFVKKIRKYFPKQPIVVITNNKKTYGQMNLVRGAYSIFVNNFGSMKEFESNIKEIVIEKGFAKKGDKIVISGGKSVGNIGITDALKILDI